MSSNFLINIIQLKSDNTWIKYTFSVPSHMTGNELIEITKMCLIGYSHFDDNITIDSLGIYDDRRNNRCKIIYNDNGPQTLLQLDNEFRQDYSYSINNGELYVHWNDGRFDCCSCLLRFCCFPCICICKDAYTTQAFIKSFEMPPECIKISRGIYIYYIT